MDGSSSFNGAMSPRRGYGRCRGEKWISGSGCRDAAAREVAEETGLEVEIGEVIWVGEHISEHGHIVLIDFLGRWWAES